VRHEDVKLVPGGVGQFDVEVDGRLVFSKAKAGRFPDDAEVVAALFG
jgi:selT/selW/selH-like putative selenoprotein